MAEDNRFHTVELTAPIKRGEATIDTLNVRRPGAGELRSLSLSDLMTSDATALLKLIPRITEPPLTTVEADALDPADFAEIGGVIRGFFMTRAEKAAIEQMIAEHLPKT